VFPSISFFTLEGCGGLGKGFVEATDETADAIRLKLDAGSVLLKNIAIATVVKFWGFCDAINTNRGAILPVVFGAALNV
jgi:hypothetical protein